MWLWEGPTHGKQHHFLGPDAPQINMEILGSLFSSSPALYSPLYFLIFCSDLSPPDLSPSSLLPLFFFFPFFIFLSTFYHSPFSCFASSSFISIKKQVSPRAITNILPFHFFYPHRSEEPKKLMRDKDDQDCVYAESESKRTNE